MLSSDNTKASSGHGPSLLVEAFKNPLELDLDELRQYAALDQPAPSFLRCGSVHVIGLEAQGFAVCIGPFLQLAGQLDDRPGAQPRWGTPVQLVDMRVSGPTPFLIRKTGRVPVVIGVFAVFETEGRIRTFRFRVARSACGSRPLPVFRIVYPWGR